MKISNLWLERRLSPQQGFARGAGVMRFFFLNGKGKWCERMSVVLELCADVVRLELLFLFVCETCDENLKKKGERSVYTMEYNIMCQLFRFPV